MSEVKSEKNLKGSLGPDPEAPRSLSVTSPLGSIEFMSQLSNLSVRVNFLANWRLLVLSELHYTITISELRTYVTDSKAIGYHFAYHRAR